MSPAILAALAMGVAIAAATGLRAFLPLLAIGLAGRFGWIELKPETAWLAGNPAIVALTIATLLEILGDKIPAVDHALDLVATVVRPLAGWLGAYAVMANWPAPWGSIVALALGGGALGLHLMKAQVRLGSTALTLGHANPLLSLVEDATAGALLLVAVLAPLFALVLVAVLVVVVLRLRRARIAAAAAPAPRA